MKKRGARYCMVMIGVAMQTLAAFAEPAATDETAIRHVLMSTWDKPESPLRVEAVAIVSNHALASWTQGTHGGRALMFRNAEGQWMVQACGGDGLVHVTTLEQSGIPARDAGALAVTAKAAESTLPQATRQLFSTFDAKMGASSSDSTAHKQHAH